MLDKYFSLRKEINDEIKNLLKEQDLFELKIDDEEEENLPTVSLIGRHGETFVYKIVSVQNEEQGFKGEMLDDFDKLQTYWFEQSEIELFDLCLILELMKNSLES